MKIKCDEGYGAWSITRNEDGTFTFVQIKKEVIKEAYEMFETELKGLISAEEYKEELENIRDFVIGLFSDIVRDNSFKKEILSKEEYKQRYS